MMMMRSMMRKIQDYGKKLANSNLKTMEKIKNTLHAKASSKVSNAELQSRKDENSALRKKTQELEKQVLSLNLAISCLEYLPTLIEDVKNTFKCQMTLTQGQEKNSFPLRIVVPQPLRKVQMKTGQLEQVYSGRNAVLLRQTDYGNTFFIGFLLQCPQRKRDESGIAGNNHFSFEGPSEKKIYGG